MKFLLFFLFFSFLLGAKAQDIGYATYYGKKMHKRKTASGETYHRDSLVCAHRTYPFGTLLNVKNIKTGKSVIVKVIDRGPFSKRRIIDLSYAAAKELDIIHHGVAQVEITTYEEVKEVVSED